mmetsp:Transcript_63476/g.133812  ORF Transcript_63476/g.133812 Transcript_63476/m.133812 type:complete len:249 (-) Transcript_63476:1143-1889(-)
MMLQSGGEEAQLVGIRRRPAHERRRRYNQGRWLFWCCCCCSLQAATIDTDSSASPQAFFSLVVFELIAFMASIARHLLRCLSPSFQLAALREIYPEVLQKSRSPGVPQPDDLEAGEVITIVLHCQRPVEAGQTGQGERKFRRFFQEISGQFELLAGPSHESGPTGLVHGLDVVACGNGLDDVQGLLSLAITEAHRCLLNDATHQPLISVAQTIVGPSCIPQILRNKFHHDLLRPFAQGPQKFVVPICQ